MENLDKNTGKIILRPRISPFGELTINGQFKYSLSILGDSGSDLRERSHFRQTIFPN